MTAGFRWLARTAVVLACVASAAGRARAAEAPPPQGSRLLFQKTLSIQTTARGRVFSETRRVEEGDTLSGTLAKDYGISGEALPALDEAFRAINPGLDPDRLPPGATVKIPFKLEESPASPPPEPLPPEERTYSVRRGESLWRILKNRFKVTREAMPKALAAVARANPTIRNLDHVVEGQRLVIPETVGGKPKPAPPAPPVTPAWGRSIFALLTDLGCRVATSGETFLPLARGRAIRLDGREFPIVAGPGGRRVIFDPGNRMSVALTRDIGEAWGYTVLQGTETDPEGALAKILPRLGFHEVAEGPRTIRLAPGVEVTARPRWAVIARPEDAWEGQVHLLFGARAHLDPDLAALALQAGFSLHSLGEGPALGTTPRGEPLPEPVPELSFAEPGSGEGAVLGALGVSHRVRPDVECDLGGGVRYHLRPDLTFDHGGTAYAVPPQEPRRADALLARAGYFTVRLPDPAEPFTRLSDLLALLGIRAERVTLRVPSGDQGLALSVRGLVFEAPAAARRLYPRSGAKAAKVLLTEARVPPLAARLLTREGLAPWILRPRSSSIWDEAP